MMFVTWSTFYFVWLSSLSWSI